MCIYGAIDDFYQKSVLFSKSICCIRLSTVYTVIDNKLLPPLKPCFSLAYTSFSIHGNGNLIVVLFLYTCAVLKSTSVNLQCTKLESDQWTKHENTQ